jgi:four helix bundle protein
VAIQNFEQLDAWKAAVDLIVDVYNATENYPTTERFALMTQMRRAAVSIAANVAEGNSRYSTAAYVNHVNMALGSHGELRALLVISRRLGLTNDDVDKALLARLTEVGRLLAGLRRALIRRVEHQRSS